MPRTRSVKPTPAPPPPPPPSPRPRGRPRSNAARSAVLRAARQLLAEGGVAAVTVEALAIRARVGKPTIYRSWPNAQAVAMAALMDQLDARVKELPRGNAMTILRAQLRDIVRVFATSAGRHVASMLASADPASELGRAFRNHFILARREEGRAILEQAISQGDLRADLDLTATLDLLYAPVFYRLLLGHAPLDDRFSDAILDHLLAGLAPAGVGGRRTRRTRAPP